MKLQALRKELKVLNCEIYDSVMSSFVVVTRCCISYKEDKEVYPLFHQLLFGRYNTRDKENDCYYRQFLCYRHTLCLLLYFLTKDL